MQKFTPQGGPPELAPSIIGSSEVQSVVVNAGDGQFKLSYGADPNATTGIGTLTNGSTTITNVSTSTGAFTVGQQLQNPAGGVPGFSSGIDVFITSVGATTLTVSQPAINNKTSTALTAGLPYKTVDLPYNAPPNDSVAGTPGTIDSVEEALNALPSIGAKGGSVTVTGGPGDPGGSSPYVVTFDGGSFARTDALPMVGFDGTTALSGGSGSGSNAAGVTTTAAGGVSGTSESDAPIDIGGRAGRSPPRAQTVCGRRSDLSGRRGSLAD